MGDDFDRDEELRRLQDEAREWIEAITGEEFPTDDWVESLKDGVLLCMLINEIAPGSVKRINKSKMPFKKMENIANFLKAARAFGMNEFEMFGTPDLFDEKNVRQVVSSIHALGRTVQAKLPDWGRPHLGIKVVEKNVRVWTEEQLRAASVSVSLLNLGSSDHGKKAAEAVLDGTGELDESGKADKLKKAEQYKQQMLRDSALRTGETTLDKQDAKDMTAFVVEGSGAQGIKGASGGAGGSGATSSAGGSGDAWATKVPKWEKVAHEDGSVYYRHIDTYETQWELPPGEKLIGDDTTGGDAGDGEAAATGAGTAVADGKWEEVPQEDGTVYYRHIETYETAWELPPGEALVGSGGAVEAPVAPAPAEAAPAPPAPEAAAVSGGMWEEVAHEDGSVYYRHIETYETAWELPPGESLVGEAGAGADGDAVVAPAPAADAGAAEGGDVYEMITGEDGSVYYRHTVTWETCWELPEGATLANA